MKALSNLLIVGVLLAASSPAQAHDWYEASKTQCLDITSSASTSENPQLETPEGTQALYQSLGQMVSSKEVEDASGAPIIMMHINDSDGHPFLNFTFYPSVTDCRYVLAYTGRYRRK
jgi:hypothetical protein